MNDIQNLIEERLEKLPNEVRLAIESVPWQDILELIAKRHDFDAETTDSFKIETAMVVLGIEAPNKYPDNLVDEVGLSVDKAIEIALEVEKEIINPILSKVEQKEPVVITPETKDEALKKLNQKEDVENLPMIESGESAHEVKPTIEINKPEEKPKLAQTPNYGYEAGKDPYREPLV